MIDFQDKRWLWALILELISPLKFKMLALMFLGLVMSAVGLSMPVAAGFFAESLLATSAVDWLVPALALTGLLITQATLGYVNGRLEGYASQTLLFELQERFYDRLQRLPLTTSRRHTRGDLVAMFDNDASALVSFIFGTSIGMVPVVLTFVGALVLMMLIEPVVSVMALVVIPVIVAATGLVGKKIRPVSEEIFDFHGRGFALLEENTGMLPLIKSAAAEDEELSRLRGIHKSAFSLTMESIRLQLLLSPITQLGGGLAVLLAMVLTTRVGGISEVGELVSLLLYGLMMMRSVSASAGIYGSWQETTAAVSRLGRILSEPPEDAEVGDNLKVAQGPSIVMRKVSFGYDQQHPVFRDFSLDIAAGELIVLTGPNGIGKSTLAELVCRFLEPESGSILINDQDVSAVKLADLRRTIGYVCQNVTLFDRSVRENLVYPLSDTGCATVELEPVLSTGILNFITRLDRGLDESVGPGGNRLSGGQRQRIALARVLVQRHPVMIFDESVSMLDVESFTRVRQMILEATECTRIVIDHDTTKWQGAGRIVELSELDPKGRTN